ncbi:DUF317 domain-containing protein [Streptomyces sp. SAS_281]|uniref:DUF317 domain-containing protein n=1 Tax=Streptomyces sp. SAS_281 TaxID=3412744 RepID=UPI00403C72B1
MHAPDDPYQQEVLVSPMYLAGSNGTGEAGFAPVAQWPHQYLDEGPCQLLVTSPDQRIRIGWFGDDFELWKISAAEDAFSAPRWTATFNHVTPAEIVAGLTTALVQDYDEAIASDTPGRFLTGPAVPWRDTVRPLTDAGWTLDGGAELGTVEIIAPDDQAGILIDRRGYGSDRTTVELWAGPPGWGTRAEATFAVALFGPGAHRAGQLLHRQLHSPAFGDPALHRLLVRPVVGLCADFPQAVRDHRDVAHGPGPSGGADLAFQCGAVPVSARLGHPLLPLLSPAARHRNPCRTTAVGRPFPGLPSPASGPSSPAADVLAGKRLRASVCRMPTYGCRENRRSTKGSI